MNCEVCVGSGKVLIMRLVAEPTKTGLQVFLPGGVMVQAAVSEAWEPCPECLGLGSLSPRHPAAVKIKGFERGFLTDG